MLPESPHTAAVVKAPVEGMTSSSILDLTDPAAEGCRRTGARYGVGMRPDRFLRLALTAAPTIPGVTRAEQVTDDGRSKRPYLLAIETGGKTTRWQVAAVSAPGDSYDQPEREPVLGDTPEPPTAPPAEAGSPEHVEGALIAALLAADPGGIAGVEAYSQRQPAGAIVHGATFLFHDGSKIFLNHVR